MQYTNDLTKNLGYIQYKFIKILISEEGTLNSKICDLNNIVTLKRYYVFIPNH